MHWTSYTVYGKSGPRGVANFSEWNECVRRAGIYLKKYYLKYSLRLYSDSLDVHVLNQSLVTGGSWFSTNIEA